MTNLPEWANWLARDEDGELWAYAAKPIKTRYNYFLEYVGQGECGMLLETDDTFKHIKFTDEEPTRIKSIAKEFLDEAESLRELGEALTRNWEAEHGKQSVAEYNQWQITQAKAHGYDELPTVADKTEHVYVVKDGDKITSDETHSISFEEAMVLVENKVDDIADKRYETPDIINKPTHYQGLNGLEVRDVHANFVPHYAKFGGLVMCDMKDVIKYVLRAPNENGVEDLKKAKRHLEWVIEELEAVE